MTINETLQKVEITNYHFLFQSNLYGKVIQIKRATL